MVDSHEELPAKGMPKGPEMCFFGEREALAA